MSTEFAAAVASVVLSLVSLMLGLRKHDSKKHEARLTARAQHGRQTAALALDAVAGRSLPADLRARAELDAFRLIDLSADGKRDFTDAQAQQYLEAERANRK